MQLNLHTTDSLLWSLSLCYKYAYFGIMLMQYIHILCRLESVNLSSIYSKIKILGTLLCVIGAVAMSISQSTRNAHLVHHQLSNSSPSPVVHNFLDKEKLVGCVYLMAAVIVLSSVVVLQVLILFLCVYLCRRGFCNY